MTNLLCKLITKLMAGGCKRCVNDVLKADWCFGSSSFNWWIALLGEANARLVGKDTFCRE